MRTLMYMTEVEGLRYPTKGLQVIMSESLGVAIEA